MNIVKNGAILGIENGKKCLEYSAFLKVFALYFLDLS